MQIILCSQHIGEHDGLRLSDTCGTDQQDATSRCRDGIKLAYEDFLWKENACK